MLKLCQHNILSSLWMTKEYHLLPCAGKFYSPERIHVTSRYLRNIQADIYCLCEVDEDTYQVLEGDFPEYYKCFSSNQPGFWNEWLEDRKWKPNGTCVFLRGDRFRDISAEKLQLTDGSSYCFVTCTDVRNNVKILIVSIHLDNYQKKMEEEEEILYWMSLKRKDVDLELVCGDYNTTDVTKFTREGFLEYISNKDTTPLPQGMIDHSLVYRTNPRISVEGVGKILSIPRDNLIIPTSGQLEISKLTPEFIATLDPELVRNVVGNICETVEANGSDHYATVTQLKISKL